MLNRIDIKYFTNLFFIVILLLCLINCSKSEEIATYKYEVKCNLGDCNVVIQNKSNAKAYYPQTPNNWSYTFKWVEGGRYCYISAKNNTSFMGEGDLYDTTYFVRVRLYKNGKVVAENTSANAFSDALISGSY